MALAKYSASYSIDDGISYTVLKDLMSVNLSVGVQAQLQQLKASTCTIVLRYPDGYFDPITDLVPGTRVLIKNIVGTEFDVWEGKISDVAVTWGIPYVNNVGNADFLEINLEGFFADLGRMDGLNYAMTGTTLTSQFTQATTESGVACAYIPTTDGRLGPATTVTGTWADWVAQTALSNNCRMRDGLEMVTGRVNIVSPFSITACTVNFSDTPSGDDQKFDVIDFDSLADNFYTQVSVNTASFGTATVTKSGATKPFRTLTVNTLSPSIGVGTDFANYLLGNYQDPALALSSLSATAEQQTTNKLDQLDLLGVANYPGKSIVVTFRGVNYFCIIEGVTMSATPNSTRFTFYVSGQDLNAYLILDNTKLGKLDENKLGY
jgi:hypothetical protein